MKKKKDLEQEINEFLGIWDVEQQMDFLRDIIPLFKLYDVDNEDDWLEKEIGGDLDNIRTIRLIRTVYLISRICQFHVGKFMMVNIKFKELWKRMEKQELGQSDNTEIESN